MCMGMDLHEREALEESLRQYEQQLQAVDLALQSSDASQAADLAELKRNLEEVISLTKTSLQTTKNESSETVLEQSHEDSSSNSIDDEFARFQAEIAGLGGGGPETSVTEDSSAQEDHSKELAELSSHLEGSKVRAPFSKDWGQMEYHNAIVLSIEAVGIAHVDDIKVNVMFTHPTAPSMKPCPFFLDGRCKFSVDRCRFSHGHAVPVSELREYSEPSFCSLTRGSMCLIRNGSGDGLWQLATVDADQAALAQAGVNKVMVRVSKTGKTLSVDIGDILPLPGEEGDSGASDSDSGSEEGSEGPVSRQDGDDDLSVPMVAWLAENSSSFPLGLWEKHTKGIGSKLMEKMGYVWGEGLGIRGNGRTEPVEAVILPAGKSLDKCMELREMGMTKDSAKVQRKMLLKLKKQEQKLERGYHKAAKSESVFDFLNGQIFSTKRNKAGDAQPVLAKDRSSSQALKSTSTKGLSVEALQVTEAIKRAQREITRLGQSSARNKDRDKVMHAHVEKQIEEQKKLIQQLQSKERSILAEQQHRKGHDKLRIF